MQQDLNSELVFTPANKALTRTGEIEALLPIKVIVVEGIASVAVIVFLASRLRWR